MAGVVWVGVHGICHGVMLHGALCMEAISGETAFIYTESRLDENQNIIKFQLVQLGT